ncbi:MAG TPA: hypothetical protein VGK74_24285 [Symbiobacteriaceae bacterium]|jgi:hypothetical protein
MRLTTIPIALLLLLSLAAPAYAGGSLPLVAAVQAGPYRISVHNNSQQVRVGTNQITVEVEGKPSAHAVGLRLTGPRGDVVQVPMRNLVVLGAIPTDEHGHGTGSPQAAMNDMPGMGAQTSTPPAAAPAGEAAPHEHGNGTFFARGQARLYTPGNWTARLEIWDEHGQATPVEVQFAVATNGPSPVFLGFTGLLILGSIGYGLIQRRHAGGSRRYVLHRV